MPAKHRHPMVAHAAWRSAAGAVAFAVGLAVSAGALLTIPVGCASAPVVQNAPPGAIGQLTRLAEKERRRPVEAAKSAPPPPGLAMDSFGPVDEAVARLSLEEAVARFGDSPEPSAPPAEPAPTDALRAYASGRAALLLNDLTVAERDLREAVDLDPGSAEARVALAETLLLRGNRIGAAAEFRAALERDPDNLRALEHLGREAAELSDDERAVELLSRAWSLPMGQRDAGLPYLIAADLGQSLQRMGWLTAGAEALVRAAEIPEPFPSASRYGRELGALYRSRPDYWRDIGDAWIRLGDDRAALQAYAEASAYPTLDDGSAVLLRRVNAAMRAGSPSAASLAVVEDALRVGRFEERHAALTRYIAATSDSDGQLLLAIDQTAAAFDPDMSRGNAGLIARTRAAAMPDAQAIPVLRQRIEAAPADAAAMSDLFERLGADNAAGALRETILLIQASPMNEPRFTRGLFAAYPDLNTLAQAWKSLPPAEATSAAGRLLRARLQATRDPIGAEEALAALLAERPDYTPALVARIETLVQLGRLGEADRLLDQLSESDSPEARYAKTLALQAMQRYRDALDMLDPLLPPLTERAAADPQHVLRAAELSIAVSDYPAAASWYTLLAQLDPAREEAYAGLIALYASNGPLANETRLTQTLRALREAAPSSRTIRRLAAREMAAIGQADRAARELQDLVAEDPSDREALALLIAVWLNAGRADLAEPWLRERIAESPSDGLLFAELARTLAQSGRADEAELLLRERLAAYPDDWDAARRLESILRGPLNRAAEADALAATRLARAPRTPDTAIELAEVQIRRGSIREAADAIQSSLGVGVSLRPDQTERLAAVTLEAAEAAVSDPAKTGATLELIDAVSEHSATLPEPLHRARIVLFSRGEAPELAVGAVQDASRQIPAGAVGFHQLAIQALSEARRYAVALDVVENAGHTLRPIDPQIGFAWVAIAVNQKDTESSLDAVRTIVKDDRVAEVINVLAPRWEPEDDYGLPSDFAHLVGGLLSQEGSEDGADALYRLSLEYNPRHAMSCNNLGYRMLERGVDIEEAERLIAVAYEELPDDVAILDSLGWARYLRGRHDDQAGADGEIIEGSVTLLRKAAAKTDPELDPITYVVIHDHLGDALWAAGRENEAVDAWTRAQRIARRTQDLIRERQAPDADLTAAAREVVARRDSLDRKLQAVAEGQEPQLARPGEAPPPAPPAGAS